MKYLALLLLTGCTTQTLDDLYLERAVCVNAKLDCSELNEVIAQKELIRQWRKNAKMECQPGYIPYCDHTMYGCGKRMAKKPVEYECISRDNMRNIWR